MVTYRNQADSILTRSILHTRLHEARQSLSAAERGLGRARARWRCSGAALAAAGRRCGSAFAALGVIGGGNFHNHYYQQLIPPLSVLAGIGGAELWRRRDRVWLAVCAAALALTAAVTVPLWFDSGAAQANAVFPHDAHLRTDAAVVRYIDAHTRPGQRVFVMWAAADIYYLADRDPSDRYMWFRNIQAIPGALGQARRMLAGPRPPALVIGVNYAQPDGQVRGDRADPQAPLPTGRDGGGRADLRAAGG